MAVKVAGHVARQIQALDHETNAVPADGEDALIEIGNDFNLATE